MYPSHKFVVKLQTRLFQNYIRLPYHIGIMVLLARRREIFNIYSPVCLPVLGHIHTAARRYSNINQLRMYKINSIIRTAVVKTGSPAVGKIEIPQQLESTKKCHK